jgi:hypothetical protein
LMQPSARTDKSPRLGTTGRTSWLISGHDAVFCLFEAESTDMIREAHRQPASWSRE